ncbi:hypothetical protein KJBENDCP_00045 [Klebsiella phage vB_KmiS-Kmi2C]|nr:hypothetical protein KJBENDCP_00045 [Klebsiella phage vB_KmiS-Kmi2C]
MTIETRLINGKCPLPGKYPLRVIRVIQEDEKTVMLVEPEEVKPGNIVDRFLNFCEQNLGDNHFLIINDCLIEDENFLTGKSYALTGTIYDRYELCELLAKDYKSGSRKGVVSKDCDFLIVGNAPNALKINRALSLGIPMISAEFLSVWLKTRKQGPFVTKAEWQNQTAQQVIKNATDKIIARINRASELTKALVKADELAVNEGVSFIKVMSEGFSVYSVRDVITTSASVYISPRCGEAVGLHQPTGDNAVSPELNRFSNDAHITPATEPQYAGEIDKFLNSEAMQAELKRMAFQNIKHRNILAEFEKQLKRASSKIDNEPLYVQLIGRGIRAEPEHVNYQFELKDDGSISVKDNGEEYHFPIWLSQLAIAYCGKSKSGFGHSHYQRYDLVNNEIRKIAGSTREYNNKISAFNRLIDFVHRSM